jgi:hypothetical protein
VLSVVACAGTTYSLVVDVAAIDATSRSLYTLDLSGTNVNVTEVSALASCQSLLILVLHHLSWNVLSNIAAL